MINIQELKTELQTDPRALGYAPLVAIGNDTGLADMLNAKTGVGSSRINRVNTTRGSLLYGIISALDQLALGVDLSSTAIPAEISSKWRNRFDAIRAGDQEIRIDAQMIGMLQQLVSDKLMAQANVDAVTKRIGSRAEALFGADTSITATDVARAVRNSNGTPTW